MNIDPDDDPAFHAAVRSLYLHLILASAILFVLWAGFFAYVGVLP